MEVIIKNTYDKKLKKDYTITIPQVLIDGKVNEYIEKARKKMSLKGFRKGHVPAAVVKEKYGASIMADESDKIISETLKKIVKESDLKLAISPKIDVKVFEEGKDIELTATLELFPEVPEIDLKKLKVVKKDIEILQSDLDESFEKLLKFYRSWQPKKEGEKAKKGDSVNIDYVGRIDKEEFEGGSAKAYQLELGSKSFIDDFEDQLVGKKAGDEIKVKVKFPKDYHQAKFAGKAAEFEVKINEVLIAELPEINDEFIKKNFGLENKEKLTEALKKQVGGNYEVMSRDLFKQELFDFLNKKYDFDLPSGLVEDQLKAMWQEVEEELKTNPEKFKNDKEKEKAKDKKREVAARMVRCGIILSDLAAKNKIEITNDDINKELGKIITRFQGQEKQVIEYYQKNQGAVNQLRGAVLEDKTIDFILALPELDRKKTSLKDFDKIWKKASEE